ncbi:MAG TPA: cellulase family glycosylhydrolase [Chitinophagaceae bacterium]|nr:cellulase family glycosylhydrolase [Chitinophagaceae bacterium]
MKRLIIVFNFNLLLLFGFAQKPEIWSIEKTNEWYSKQGWLVGANFLPSTAINQLEMWQAETYDPLTIEKELGWASGIGMNVMRVYLHDLVWQADASGFKKKMDNFLSIASKLNIKILFCIFDDCWNPDAKTGKQPEPKPGVHNSGWVRSPNKTTHDDPNKWNYLEEYVKDILTTFKNDSRILMWDLYNEPANSGYGLNSFPLLKKIFEWAWAVRPSQPLTVGVWFMEFPEINKYQLENSDVITFHNYSDTTSMKLAIDSLQKRGRPVICTEYMARTNNSKFETHLSILKKHNVGAINWGLVSGKSNTIFPWGSKEGSPEPNPWFHDIFRKDGTAYNEKETELIKNLTRKE